MGRRSEHSKEEIQEMALQAAQELVIEAGLSNMSARKIASRIGYTVGTLYIVFDNLDDLILQLNARTLDDLFDYLNRALKKSKKAEEGILALGRAYINFAKNHTHKWSAIFDHRLSKGQKIPPWFLQRVQKNFALVEQVIEPIAPKLSEKQLGISARALWSGVHGICILGFTGKLDIVGVNSVQALADSLITNYVAGIKRGK